MKRKFIICYLLATLFCINGYTQKIVKGDFTLTSAQETYTPSFKIDGVDKPIKNVILMIGDGMGLAHISSAMYANRGELTLTNLRTCGYVRTQSASNFTTDSAASGTAYATGHKTTNKFLGLSPEKQIIENLPEKLSSKGIISGVVTTDYTDGATPAAFYAHQSNRSMSKEIWADLPNSKLTFFSAGYAELLTAQEQATQEAMNKAFTVVNDPSNQAIASSERLCYLPPKGETESVNDFRRSNYLPQTTQMAIDYLSKKSKKGFFLMIEGARIDKSSHKNDYQAVIREVLDFDKAIQAAIRFAEKDGNTLVIISADHETGALSLSNGDMEKGKIEGIFVSGGHTPIMVPLFAYGPQSRLFTGIQENSDVSNKIYNLFQAKRKHK